MTDSSPTLRIAIQKSGRLVEDSVKLLRDCGFSFEFGKSTSTLRVEVANFPLTLLFLRDDDIPGYVVDGVADIGIIGENMVVESGKALTILERFRFSRCRLSLAVPKASAISSVQDLAGKRIATSYPRTLTQFLERNKVSAEIHEISGSVEIAPGIGLAEAICDLVSSGSTLLTNGLRELEVVLQSSAVLVGATGLSAEKQKLLERFRFRVQAVERAKRYKYVLLNIENKNLPEVIKLLPGLKSPTIIPLADAGWSSVHTVALEDDFWELIEKLRDVGAQGILVCALEKMVE